MQLLLFHPLCYIEQQRMSDTSVQTSKVTVSVAGRSGQAAPAAPPTSLNERMNGRMNKQMNQSITDPFLLYICKGKIFSDLFILPLHFKEMILVALLNPTMRHYIPTYINTCDVHASEPSSGCLPVGSGVSHLYREPFESVCLRHRKSGG